MTGRPERNPLKVGDVFERLTLVQRVPGTGLRWLCACTCGSQTVASKDHLKGGFKKSCGCLKSEHGRARGRARAADLSGKKLNRLTLLERTGTRGTEALWLARCECGSTVEVTSNQAVGGKVKQCPDCSRLAQKLGPTKHGATTWKGEKSAEYRVWLAMRDRCNNQNNHSYKNYGGRGIRVHPDWDDFAVFRSDMGHRPSPQHSIERKDNDEDYSAENCVWATRDQQANNRRNNRIVLYEGREMTMSQLSRVTGVPYSLIQSRLYRGWTPGDAVKTPRLQKLPLTSTKESQ